MSQDQARNALREVGRAAPMQRNGGKLIQRRVPQPGELGA